MGGSLKLPRPQTTATGARGWRAFAKSWGRFWGHIGKYTSNPAAAASTSFAGRANPPPPIWSCWPRPFCGRAAKMATASANCSTTGHTANGSAHGEPCGMQRSRAWCGTPPILGVVNMVGTRIFTCYMGAL